jgi:radical SAM protein with 4Fe4S-binding SPASM domain
VNPSAATLHIVRRIRDQAGQALRPAMRRILRFVRRTGLAPFESRWRRNSTFPRQIGLSLSVLCPSRCIYCPERASHMRPKTMPLALLEKILDEARECRFDGLFSIAENGEALTHPAFFEVLEAIRRAFPRNPIVLFSNMVLTDDEAARRIIEQDIDFLHFNIDGATEETYNYIKRNGRFDVVVQNARGFLMRRNQANARCRVGIGFVSARNFARDIEGQSDAFPDDSRAIEALVAPLLRAGDTLSPEEYQLQKYGTLLGRKKTEPCDAFRALLNNLLVAPDGNAYLCCADFGVTSSLGNLHRQNIHQIWGSDLRHDILQHIYRQEYDEAPQVCRTCLPMMGLNRDLYLAARDEIRDLHRALQCPNE